MSKELLIKNRQRRRGVALGPLKRMTRLLLEDLLRLPAYDLAVYLVDADAMARINQEHLQHEGPTDVITFDYLDGGGIKFNAAEIHGEVFVCVAVAESQAVEFGTSWESELVRYVVHGVLHLLGFDDQDPGSRKKLKLQENRLVASLEQCFDFAELDRPGSRAKGSKRRA